MTDQPQPTINISTRPFMSDMLMPATPVSAASVTPAPGNVHLLTAIGIDPTSPSTLPPQQTVTPNQSTREAALASGSDAQQTPSPVTDGYLDVDWRTVHKITKKLDVTSDANAASRRDFTDFDVAAASAGPETPYESDLWFQIVALVDRESEYRTLQNGTDNSWGPITRAHYVQAVFDTAFRYGRLQQYLREPGVEDISVVGHDNVVVVKGDGSRLKRPPMGSSDRDLEDLVDTLATARGRSYARGVGNLDLDLGGARLAVTGPTISVVTSFNIRIHSFVDIEMQTLVDNRTITAPISRFLSASSRANACVLVAGFPTVGKTTFLRAVASAIPPEDKIITIETERELYLDKLPHRHHQVVPMQELPAQFAGKDAQQGFTLEDAFNSSVRQGSQRLFLAELRSYEAVIAMKAMKAGRGAMSTIHARSAEDAIHRFADILMSEYGLSDDTVPLRQILRTVNLIIYIDFLYEADGTRRRIVTEVAEVVPSTNHTGTPMASKLFEYDWDSGAYIQPNEPSAQLMRSLNRAGYTIRDFHDKAER